MNFKGVSQPTVIRRPCEVPDEKLNIEPEIYQKLMSSYDTTRERRSKLSDKLERSTPNTKYYKSRDKTESKNSAYTTPKFIVKHQSELAIDEFINSKDAKMHAAIPKNLVVDIHLPLLSSAGDATLDVQERHLTLKSEKPAKYFLELPLSYRVNPDTGTAKFDTQDRKLTVTLPVLRDRSFHDTKEDSGVESDHGSPIPESKIVSSQSVNEDLSDSQKSENGPLISVLSENAEMQSDCVDTALRTSENMKADVSFMNPNVKYSLPAFTCNVYENVLAVTIHIKNVDSESIRHKILENNTGLHILFTSIGAGFFPVYHSLCLKIDQDTVLPETLTVEPWDNNVVLSIKMKTGGSLSEYYAGLHEEFMELKDLSAATSIKNRLQALVVNIY